MHWFLIVVGGAFGLLVGSFLNVVIHRGPAIWNLVEDDSRKGNLAWPRSYCPACHHQLSAHHLIPIFSFLSLRGKCAACAAPISKRYPLVELIAACAGIIAIASNATFLAGTMSAIFFWVLMALAVIDFETGYLPDALTLPLIGLGLTANITGLFVSFSDAAIGAVLGFTVFWAISVGFKQLRGVDGLGQGDAKLLAGLGAWLGWQLLPSIVFIAALLGLAGVGIAALRGQKIERDAPIPFGPALAAAGAIAMILSGYGLSIGGYGLF